MAKFGFHYLGLASAWTKSFSADTSMNPLWKGMTGPPCQISGCTIGRGLNSSLTRIGILRWMIGWSYFGDVDQEPQNRSLFTVTVIYQMVMSNHQRLR